MRKIIYNIVLSGLFMNFLYPEIQHQYTKYRFSGSLVEQLNQIDVNDLISNSEKYFDELGDFNAELIKQSSKTQKNTSAVVNLPSDEILKTANLKNIPGARGKILSESRKHIGIPYSFGLKILLLVLIVLVMLVTYTKSQLGIPYQQDQGINFLLEEE